MEKRLAEPSAARGEGAKIARHVAYLMQEKVSAPDRSGTKRKERRKASAIAAD